jgi:hypothetical protein
MASKKKTAKKSDAPVTDAVRNALAKFAVKAAECLVKIDSGSRELAKIVGEAHAEYVAKGKRAAKGFYGVWSAMLPADAAATLTKGRVSQLVAASRAIGAFGDMSERKARDLMQALRAAQLNTDAIGPDAKKAVTDAGGVDAYIAAHAKKAATAAKARATADSGKPAVAEAAMKDDALAYLHDVCTRTLAFIGSDADMLNACAEALEACAADYRKAATPKPTPTPSADGKATRKTPAKA